MSHHHHHHGSHTHAPPNSLNAAFAIAVGLNLAFIVVQIIASSYARSMSLLADAVHNFGDVFGLILAWGANWLLTLPARKRYSYGFKRTTILAALTNALILVGTSAVIIYESLNKLFNQTHVESLIVIVVASIGILINGGTALLFMKDAHGDLNIKGAFLHLLADAVISFGVVLAAVIIWLTGWMWLDPLVGLMIVIIILWGTWGLLRDSVALILDAIPHHIDHHGVENFLKTIPGVQKVHDFHIWGLSTKEIAMTVHLVMPENTLSDADYEHINHTLKDKFRIDHVTIQVEKGSAENPCMRSESC